MGFFDGSRNVAPSGGSNRLKPGRYPELTVVRCFVNQEGNFGTRFVLEARVSAPPSSCGERDERGNLIEPTPLGSIGSWTTDIKGRYAMQYGIPEVKSCIGAILGYDLDETAKRGEELEERMNAAVTDANPLAGLKVATEATPKKTKQQTMTKHRWFPVGDKDAPRVESSAPRIVTETPTTSVSSTVTNFNGQTTAPAQPAPTAVEWFDFPANDPRHGKRQYNRAGAQRDKP